MKNLILSTLFHTGFVHGCCNVDDGSPPGSYCCFCAEQVWCGSGETLQSLLANHLRLFILTHRCLNFNLYLQEIQPGKAQTSSGVRPRSHTANHIQGMCFCLCGYVYIYTYINHFIAFSF